MPREKKTTGKKNSKSAKTNNRAKLGFEQTLLEAEIRDNLKGLGYGS